MSMSICYCNTYYRHYRDNKNYTREIILISGFSKETTLDDIRIRFSVYGAIKACYWFSNSKKLACIIFHHTYSGVKAIIHDERREIYLHDKVLRVAAKFIGMKDSQLYLENHGGNMTINELNHDCLLEIFGYLTINETFKLKRVCKRWYTLLNTSLETLRYLNIGKLEKNMNDSESPDYKKQLQYVKRNLEQELGVKNLCYYSYGCVASLNRHLLAVNCRNLTKLIVSYSTCDERILSHIFRMNHRLRHIKIYNNIEINGESLIHLPVEIQTFIVKHCNALNSNHLCAAIKRLKNLKFLELINVPKDCLSSIFNERYENLETLHVRFKPENLNKDINKFLPITYYKNLRDLRISNYNGLNETFFVSLSKNCQELTCLKLKGGCKGITERAMNAITSLSKLEKLSIYCDEYGSTNLIKPELLKIYIEHGEIQDEYTVTIMQKLPKLRKLCLCQCISIAQNIFPEARKICQAGRTACEKCNGFKIHQRSIRRCVVFNGRIY